jgi:hypothetical protein
LSVNKTSATSLDPFPDRQLIVSVPFHILCKKNEGGEDREGKEIEVRRSKREGCLHDNILILR